MLQFCFVSSPSSLPTPIDSTIPTCTHQYKCSDSESFDSQDKKQEGIKTQKSEESVKRSSDSPPLPRVLPTSFHTLEASSHAVIRTVLWFLASRSAPTPDLFSFSSRTCVLSFEDRAVLQTLFRKYVISYIPIAKSYLTSHHSISR